MFEMLKSLTKVALSPVDVAVSVVADCVTLGGALNDKKEPYTVSAAKRLVDNASDVVKPD